MSGPRAAVLGATGMVGRRLLRRLADGGWRGVCASRGVPARAAPPGFAWAALPAEGPLPLPPSATVFSLVPLPALPPLLARADGARRLVALSTASAVHKAASADPAERAFAADVVRAEGAVARLCRERGVAWTILRPTLIYDPGRDRNVSAIAAFARRARVFPIVPPGTGLRQPIHADDVARAMLAAADAPGARDALLDLPGGETVTWREMVRRVFRAQGLRPLLLPVPAAPARLVFRAWRAATGAPWSPALLERMNRDQTLDPAPARAALGIECRLFYPEFPGYAPPTAPAPATGDGRRYAAALRDAAPVEGVSVVMVSYWTGPVLRASVEAVLAPDQEGVIELVLVDNGNPSEITAALAHRAETEPRLVLISGHGNVGFARGCNIGARRAKGRHLLLLNPDCCLAPGAVPALLAEGAALGESWMLGCRVLNPDGSDQRGSRRALLTPLTAAVEALRLYRLAPVLFSRYRLNLHDSPLPARTACVQAITGACMMLPAATFRAVGSLNEGYFLHVEDLDLCCRMHRAGIPVYFAPHVEAVHHAGSSRADPTRVEWHKTRGFLRYFCLYFRAPHWLPVLGILVVGILIRFSINAVRSRLRSA